MSRKINSERLLIEPLSFNDNIFIFELVNTNEWIRFIGDCNVHSEDDANGYIKKIIESPAIDYWVVRLRYNNSPIGIVSFVKRDYLPHHDIGYAFLSTHSNNGYAYEATEAILYYVIGTGEHSVICSITNAENVNAIKLIKKTGLVFARDIEIKDERLQLYEASIDRILISMITKSFFSVFTNKGNAQPPLELLNSICIPEIRITNRNRSKADTSDLVTFINKRKRILTDGTLREFEEKEIDEKTIIEAGIGTRFSRYKKTGIAYRQRFNMNGYKLFHFVKIYGSWKISSIVWEDEVDQ